jgi:hypothetical protein
MHGHPYAALAEAVEEVLLGRPGDYSGRIRHPWSEAPRSAEFWIAVRVGNGQRRRLTVEELFARNIRESAADDSPCLVRRTLGAEASFSPGRKRRHDTWGVLSCCQAAVV